MKLAINVEYSATADRPGETEQDEERILDSARELFGDAVAALRRRCEAEGVDLMAQG
jgi:hypothetical protein